MWASGTRVDLRELAEHQLVVIARDAATGITDFDEKLILIRTAPRKCYPDPSAVLCELYRVPNQVCQDVLDLVSIGIDAREVVAIGSIDGNVLFGCQRLVEQSHLIDNLGDREFGAHERHLITGATDICENLVDHVQQLLAAIDDASDAVALFRVQLTEHAITQYLCVGDDGSERCAQIVRDIRQELRLQRVTRGEVVDGFLRLASLSLKCGY